MPSRTGEAEQTAGRVLPWTRTSRSHSACADVARGVRTDGAVFRRTGSSLWRDGQPAFPDGRDAHRAIRAGRPMRSPTCSPPQECHRPLRGHVRGGARLIRQRYTSEGPSGAGRPKGIVAVPFFHSHGAFANATAWNLRTSSSSGISGGGQSLSRRSLALVVGCLPARREPVHAVRNVVRYSSSALSSRSRSKRSSATTLCRNSASLARPLAREGGLHLPLPRDDDRQHLAASGAACRLVGHMMHSRMR